MRHLFRLALVTLIGIGATSANAAPIVIDSFQSPSPFASGIGSPFTHTQIGGAGLLGGATRTVNAALQTLDAAAVGANIPFGPPIGTINGLAVFTGISAVTTDVTYTFPGATNLNGLGLSFTMAFVDEGLPAGPPGIVADITINTTTGTLTGSVPLFASISSITYTALYSAFTGPGNLGAVNSIVIELNNSGTPQQGTDFVLTQLAVAQGVPEPSTFVLAGMFVGLLGGGLFLRRRSTRCAATLAA